MKKIFAVDQDKNHNTYRFTNWLLLSAIWGYGSYTKYREVGSYFDEIPAPEEVEIALIDAKTGKFVGQELLPDTFQGNDVAGWISLESLSFILDQVGKLSYHKWHVCACLILRYYWTKFKSKIRSTKENE